MKKLLALILLTACTKRPVNNITVHEHGCFVKDTPEKALICVYLGNGQCNIVFKNGEKETVLCDDTD